MTLGNLKAYAFLLRHFRNGSTLIRNYRGGGLQAHGPAAPEAVLWDGTRLIHPAGRGGLVGTLLEIWFDNSYELGSFYGPRDGDVIIDLGANIGLFTLWLLRQNSRCRIVAVEPSPENYACLQANLASARGKNVEAYRLAVAGHAGTGKMAIDTNRSTDSRLEVSDSADAEAVEIVTLADLLDRIGAERIALLKMDIEGSEHGIFQAADSELLSRFDRMALEYHDNLIPGTLDLLKERLAPTHEVEVKPTKDRGYGRLFARLRAAS